MILHTAGRHKLITIIQRQLNVFSTSPKSDSERGGFRPERDFSPGWLPLVVLRCASGMQFTD